jgi:PrsW family intramembrane metalloprotease
VKSAPSWRSLAFLVASLGGMGLSLSTAVSMAGFLAFSLIQNDMESAGFSAWTSASSMGVAIALLPGTFWAFQSVFGRPESPPRSYPSRWMLIALLLPLGLGIGHVAFQSGGRVGSIVIGPAAHVLTALTAAATVVALALRRGPALSASRATVSFTIGLTAIPFMAIMLEAIVLIPALVIGAAALISTPEGIGLVRSLVALGPDPGALSPELLTPWLQQPLVIAMVFAFTAGVVPAVEELAKTAAVWTSLRRGLPAGQAFLTGVMAGAGYGLFEALFLSQPGAEWSITAIGRIGAAFMHAATAGITSWGLMEWARERRWTRALAAYGVAVLGHALWNLAALSAGYEALLRETGPAGTQGEALSFLSVGSVVVLVALSLTAVALIARRDRSGAEPSGGLPQSL